ncbi:MAG: RNA polymerase sigma factor [Acidimicrobiales bacterium]
METVAPRREDSAFANFYRDAVGPCQRLTYLLVGDAGAAEELTQDAFIAVYRRFRSVRDPYAYARACIVHAAARRGRRDRRWRQAAPLLARPDAIDDGSRDEFGALVAALTPRQATAVFLRLLHRPP